MEFNIIHFLLGVCLGILFIIVCMKLSKCGSCSMSNSSNDEYNINSPTSSTAVVPHKKVSSIGYSDTGPLSTGLAPNVSYMVVNGCGGFNALYDFAQAKLVPFTGSAVTGGSIIPSSTQTCQLIITRFQAPVSTLNSTESATSGAIYPYAMVEAQIIVNGKAGTWTSGTNGGLYLSLAAPISPPPPNQLTVFRSTGVGGWWTITPYQYLYSAFIGDEGMQCNCFEPPTGNVKCCQNWGFIISNCNQCNPVNVSSGGLVTPSHL